MDKTNTVSKGNKSGWINGFIGVVLFSGSLPATKLAVQDLDPVFVTLIRAAVAGLLALAVLTFFGIKRPNKQAIIPLSLVTIGAVIGFPLLSALALQHMTSAHSIVFVGLLPLVTASFGVLRGGERPKPIFWLFSILGSLLVVGYAIREGLTVSPVGDLLMLGAILLCGLGYAEGARLAKSMEGWQVISWGLVFALPFLLPFIGLYWPTTLSQVSTPAWIGLAYVSMFSMFIGFIFWYRGLAQGGIAQVGQLQLLQPFFAMTLAATILHETVSTDMIAVTAGVVLCVAGTKKFGS
ncbi:DMT family transporter [Sphingobacterium psychroaquaticum]|uniref:Permease of the drug/metabolite transporter (DMT) superfamily n=1 Tax=Sphingobacterium psychroaquaticum TaxID=561061 RepID=A0A1X7IJJ7_9SPHI|nr:DMT family transporter [Sphingobacterium psychroaquaticum]SMG15008.1 Permease of the drug/metabolite transporter (DMT) superfamily [Sphingobacterium psychroaquaticum]